MSDTEGRAAFWAARLDEAEAAAKVAARCDAFGRDDFSGEWSADDFMGRTRWDVRVDEYIALNDPASILRSIEGDRLILRAYRQACAVVAGWEHEQVRETLEACVRARALRWSDHPDYRAEAWKP